MFFTLFDNLDHFNFDFLDMGSDSDSDEGFLWHDYDSSDSEVSF